MGNIIILDEGTANRIAAGEVVERPSSVIKELIENSTDAGAKRIAVDIKKGGIASMTVADDGEGFYDDDVLMAFERHATSKLRTAEDLERIMTLGFRGEALPSIASVSKLRLVTRRRDAEYGRLVEFHGGRLVRDEKAGCPSGTAVTVSELFYNLPARYKFLKKDSAEAAQISELVGRLAIGRPDISFTLTTQNAQVLHTQGGGSPGDAVYSVLGKDVYTGLTPLGGGAAPNTAYTVTGFAGGPETARSNRNFQLFYINGRLVKNRVIYSAIEEAYKSHLPVKRFPVAVLYIALDASLVDVNAHPAKTEVRFQNEGDLFRAVYHAVTSALRGMDSPGTMPDGGGGARIWPIRGAGVQAGHARQMGMEPWPIREAGAGAGPTHRAVMGPWPGRGTDADVDIGPGRGADALSGVIPSGRIPEPDGPPIRTDRESGPAPLDTPRYIGQVFGTYLVFEDGDTLVIMDQHAAHERSLYERIKAQFVNKAIARQVLLESVTVNLLPDEMQFVQEAGGLFAAAGFMVEEFGLEAVVIREIPLYLERVDIKGFFLDALEIIRKNYKRVNSPDGTRAPYDDMLYDIACKAAVKANKKFTQQEAEALYRTLDSLPKPLTCPHGRPLIVKMHKRDFDKMFRRI